MDKEQLEEIRYPLIDQRENALIAFDTHVEEAEFCRTVVDGLSYKIDLLTQLIDEEYRREEEVLRAECERQGEQATAN